MSSTSRSPDDKPDPPDDAEKKRSPGRYSLADEAEVPPTRIDSTTRMPAVRPDVLPPRSSGPNSLPKPSQAVVSKDTSKDTPKDTKKKPPIGLPVRPPVPASSRAPTPPAVESSAKKDDGSAKAAEARAAEGDATVDAALSETPREKKSVAPRPISNVPPKAGRRVSSLRPPPPPGALVASSHLGEATPFAPVEGESESLFMLDGLDEGSIAFAFDALVSEGPAGAPGTHSFDLTPVRELFSELAANHMRHVRDFMIDVKWGEVTRDWIHICVPPVRTLRRAAQHLELMELGDALERLGVELDTANATGGQMLDASEKQRLLDAYGELVAILPQAFALDRDKTQREAVIVQALLLQVPDVRKVTIDKLHAAGLTSLSVLFGANANDIAHVAGIPHALAARIVERVEQYRDELKSSSPQDARAAERDKLATLTATLKEEHGAYEEAGNAWGPEAKAKKRDHFRRREEIWLEISVLLARFGEVDRLQGIEKVPFSQRITQLGDYLEEARDKYRSAEG